MIMNGSECGERYRYRKKGQGTCSVSFHNELNCSLNELTDGDYNRSDEAVPKVNDVVLRRCRLGP